MTAFARLRDVFLAGLEPERAVFCTYGFDARFFETEVLPAMLSESLALDREAGSSDGYLNAADVALQPTERSASFTTTFSVTAPNCSTAAGRSTYSLVGSMPSSSCSTTATAFVSWWGRRTSRAPPGRPSLSYGWRRTSCRVSLTRGQVDSRASSRTWQCASPNNSLSSVPPSPRSLKRVPEGRGDERIVSTWDEPLLDAFFGSLPPVTTLNVVSPFFEGSDGPGVFDALKQRAETARGELYASVSFDEGKPRVSGPPAKLANFSPRSAGD